MTARLVPLTPELFQWAVAEEADPATAIQAREPHFVAQFCNRRAIGAALIGEGRVLAAGGLMPQWYGRGLAWLMLSPRAAAPHRTMALREVRRSLESAQHFPEWRRVEMVVRLTEPWGDRFAEFLGMHREGTLEAYDPLGRDYKLFARIAPKAVA